MELPEIAPKTLFMIGDFKVTVTMFSSVIVSAVLIIFALIVRGTGAAAHRLWL